VVRRVAADVPLLRVPSRVDSGLLIFIELPKLNSEIKMNRTQISVIPDISERDRGKREN
jgi:hypothetical protein